MEVAGAGAGAEIMVIVGAGAENKLFRLCNTAFDTRCSSRLKRLFLDHEEPVYKVQRNIQPRTLFTFTFATFVAIRVPFLLAGLGHLFHTGKDGIPLLWKHSVSPLSLPLSSLHVCGVCRHTCTVPCPLAPAGTHHVPLSSPSFARQDFVHHARACLLLQCKKLFHSCLVFYTFFVFVPGRKMWPPSRTVPYVYCTKSNTKASFFLLLKYLLLVQVPEMHICGHETHLGPLRGGETAQI